MNKEVLATLTKEYDLTPFHEEIILAVEHKELSADEICDVTKIPKGRIYSFLNFLIENKLIEKIHKTPAVYSAKNFEENVVDFLRVKFEENQERERELISLIGNVVTDNIDVVDSREKYSKAVIRLLKSAKVRNVILREKIAPFILYPREVEDYTEIRKRISKNRIIFTKGGKGSYEFHEEYIELSNNCQSNYVIDEQAIDDYIAILKDFYGPTKYKSFIKMKLRTINKIKTSIKVVKQPIPYSLYVAENEAMIILIYKKNIIGLVTSNKQIIDIYQNIHSRIFDSGINLESYLKKKYHLT